MEGATADPFDAQERRPTVSALDLAQTNPHWLPCVIAAIAIRAACR